MEKYGVEQSKDEGTKTAAKAGTCPECGKPLETSAMVHKCPVHGTKPFEAKKEDTDGQGKP